jgi:hypothetical protein
MNNMKSAMNRLQEQRCPLNNAPGLRAILLYTIMSAVAKRRRFCMLALAKPDSFGFIKLNFNTSVRFIFNIPVGIITKGRGSCQSATAPGINFSRHYINADRLAVR